MPASLDGLLRRGFKFVTVSQLLALNPPVNTTSPAGEAAFTPADNSRTPASALAAP
ncbi:MAG: hypothetical protein HN759_06170 [Akkermansiaceae bacterium]|nr:hypothetical protein [Akkermansiaceae bacterium]